MVVIRHQSFRVSPPSEHRSTPPTRRDNHTKLPHRCPSAVLNGDLCFSLVIELQLTDVCVHSATWLIHLFTAFSVLHQICSFVLRVWCNIFGQWKQISPGQIWLRSNCSWSGADERSASPQVRTQHQCDCEETLFIWCDIINNRWI